MRILITTATRKGEEQTAKVAYAAAAFDEQPLAGVVITGFTVYQLGDRLNVTMPSRPVTRMGESFARSIVRGEDDDSTRLDNLRRLIEAAYREWKEAGEPRVHAKHVRVVDSLLPKEQTR